MKRGHFLYGGDSLHDSNSFHNSDSLHNSHPLHATNTLAYQRNTPMNLYTHLLHNLVQ